MNLDSVAVDHGSDADDIGLGDPPTMRQRRALRLSTTIIADQASAALEIVPGVSELDRRGPITQPEPHRQNQGARDPQ